MLSFPGDGAQQCHSWVDDSCPFGLKRNWHSFQMAGPFYTLTSNVGTSFPGASRALGAVVATQLRPPGRCARRPAEGLLCVSPGTAGAARLQVPICRLCVLFPRCPPSGWLLFYAGALRDAGSPLPEVCRCFLLALRLVLALSAGPLASRAYSFHSDRASSTPFPSVGHVFGIKSKMLCLSVGPEYCLLCFF